MNASMLRRFALLGAVSAIAILGASPQARADTTISVTLPGPVNGPLTSNGNPYPTTTGGTPGGYRGDVTIGNFVFTIPAGYTIAAASWTGQWGTGIPNINGSCSTASNCPHTAIETINVAGYNVANCPNSSATCWLENTPSQANYTFSSGQYGALYSGNVPAYSNQTGGNVVRLGPETLNLTLVPEPASMALFGSGLLGLFAVLRRRRAREDTSPQSII
jgi:hypothetical protein